MPHGWRSRGRWPGWRGAWRFADRARWRSAIVRAFVDRTSIDWAAARGQAVDADERAFIEGLRRLASIRGTHAECARGRTIAPWIWPVAGATALGAAQVLAILAVGAMALPSGAPHAGSGGPQLALAVAFSAASLLLAAAALRDHRALLLLATFVLTATAFARPLLAGAEHGALILATPLFRGVYPEVFASAALWELAAVFPSVRRFTPLDVFVRRAAMLVWVLAGGLFLANVALASAPSLALLGPLERDHAGNLYWRLFAAITLPAVALIVVRAHRAPRLERLKVARFAAAIAAGAGPFLVLGAARLVPAVDAWTRSLDVRTWMDPIVLLSLGALPVLTSVAVLVDRPFERPAPTARPASRAGRGFDRMAAFCARPLRNRRLRDHLAAAVDQVRLARSSRELLAVLCRELQAGVGASAVRTVGTDLLPSDSALNALLAGAAGPIDLDRDGEAFLLLPASDRAWIEANDVTVLAAIRLRDGSSAAIVLVESPLSGGAFTRTERWFIRTLVAAAAAAWPSSPEPPACEDAADECGRCGGVRTPAEPPCCPDASVSIAYLPRQLAGKYTVARRLGAGGMGVVYLAQDDALGRAVALKTLPGLREGAVDRLQDEARIVATLDHPAIARIHAVETWRGTPVLVLEYLPGGTLADLLVERRLPVDDVLRLGIRLADALTYVHARGLLHRDIKPGNIGFGADGNAKLLDFGVAAAEEARAGTAAYLPPEVLAGAAPDRYVDLWALAVVLRGACEPDDRLAGFLNRALARRRRDRYGSSEEVSAALKRLLDEAADS